MFQSWEAFDVGLLLIHKIRIQLCPSIKPTQGQTVRLPMEDGNIYTPHS